VAAPIDFTPGYWQAVADLSIQRLHDALPGSMLVTLGGLPAVSLGRRAIIAAHPLWDIRAASLHPTLDAAQSAAVAARPPSGIPLDIHAYPPPPIVVRNVKAAPIGSSRRLRRAPSTRSPELLGARATKHLQQMRTRQPLPLSSTNLVYVENDTIKNRVLC